MINPFHAYLGGVASWFANMGLQFVMIPVAVIYLKTTATKLALVQICLSVPQILCCFSPARWPIVPMGAVLVNIHLIATIPPIILGWLVGAVIWVLSDCLCAVGRGHIFIFLNARCHVDPRHPHRRAKRRDGGTHHAICCPAYRLFAGRARCTGCWAQVLLAMQVVVMAFRLFVHSRYRHCHPAPAQDLNTPDRGWRTGVDAVIRSPTLYPVILSTISVGIFSSAYSWLLCRLSCAMCSAVGRWKSAL